MTFESFEMDFLSLSIVYKYFINTLSHDCPSGQQSALLMFIVPIQMDSVMSINGWLVLGKALPEQFGVKDQMVQM